MNYLPLNVLSGYSFLESGLKVEDIVAISKDNGNSFSCLCDDSNMYGYPLFNSLCKKDDIKPIFSMGLEIIINNKPLLVKLVIENEEGYLNLCKLLSKQKNLSNLLTYSKGLTLIIPTISNSRLCEILIENEENFSKIVSSVTKPFVNWYFGIEIYSKEDKEIINKYRSYSSKNHCKCVLFNKVLYKNKSDALTYNILQAIKYDHKINLKNDNSGPYYLLNDKEASQLFTKEELNATFSICQSVDFELMKKRGRLLKYTNSMNLSERKFLEFMCINNAKKKGISLDNNYLDRMNYEIDVIDKMGYCSYFLIVQDYVNFAKDNNIPVGPGRGSACGSLVSYLLGITEIDPLKYNLMFERFLNPQRVTMPDIDIDIADYARSKVIDYIYKKYGKEKMANIITFQTIGAKQSLRDIGRVFSFNNADINTLCMKIKGQNTSLDDSIKNNKEFNALYSDDYFSKIISLAKRIEGFPRQDSLHAAGIIINEEDLTSLLPTKEADDGKLICEFEAAYLEELGFLKMDILSLRNLSIIFYCENQIKKVNPSFSLRNISLNDSKTFDVLNAGLTKGIFQLESEGITSSLKKIKIQSFDDLVALLALYRPGPMDNIDIYADRKNNHKEVTYPHHLVKEILEPTYGVIIYQEQIMEIVQKIALFSLSEADLFRRAISKKDQDKLLSLKSQFMEGARKNHIDDKVSENIFNLIDKFANYGFNKSHSVSYSLITYQMAYLKANYPLYFYATNLSFLSSSSDRFSKFKNEFNLFQIKLSLPSINYSSNEYQVKDSKILLPLSLIKGLNYSLSEQIIQERKKNNLFTSFEDFILRMLKYNFNESHFMSLINSGALDCFSLNRATMRKNLSTIIKYSTFNIGTGLLSSEDLDRFKPKITIYEDDKELNLEEEYESLGVMISGSLLDKYSNYIKAHNIKEIFSVSSSSYTLKIGVIIKSVKVITTKNNTKMAICLGFDNTSEVEIIFFSKQYEEYNNLIKVNNPLCVQGYFKKDESNRLSFIASNVELMEENK